MIVNKPITLIDENIPLLMDILDSVAEVRKCNGRVLNNALLKESECDALFIRSVTKIDSELLEGTNIKLIGSATSGIDHVDLFTLKKNKIKFYHAPGSNANSVAEYVVYGILLWAEKNNIDIKKQSIGIIGFGCIGKLVAKYAAFLGMTILINDPPLLEDKEVFPDNYIYSDLKTIFSTCSVITNHVPLTNSGLFPTYDLINKENLKHINQGSLLIHCSRGKVVNESALLEVMNTKNVDAVIDVWSEEPNFNVELAQKSLISTPHIAGYSWDGKLKGTLKMALEFQNYYNTKIDFSLINKEFESYDPTPDYFFLKNNFIYSQIKQNRMFDDDNKNFKEIINMERESRIKAFDLQRKNYPKRRESL